MQTFDVIADWKDIDGLAEQFVYVLNQTGHVAIEHPLAIGSSTYGFLVDDSHTVVADDADTLANAFSDLLSELGFKITDLGADTDTYWFRIE